MKPLFSKTLSILVLGCALGAPRMAPLVHADEILLAQAQTAQAETAPAAPAQAETLPPAEAPAPAEATATAPAPAPAAPAAAPAETPPSASNVQAVTQAYNSGVAALRAGNLESAGDYFEKTISLSPDDAMAKMLLGYVRLKQGRYEDALLTLEAAQKTASKLDIRSQAIIHNNIGMAYWNQKDYAKALPAYQQAIALDKTYADARYNLAFALLSQSKGKEALPHFTELAAKNPSDPMLQDGLGQTYESLNDWPKAFAAYKKAIELNPKDSSYPLNLALAYIRSDPNGANKARRDAAIQNLRRASTLNPQGAPAFLQLGLLLIEKKRWPEAQDMLRRYTVLKPDDFLGQFNLALSYDYAGNKFDDALKIYGKAEALQPQDPAVKNNVGRIYLKRKLYNDSIAQFRKALEIDPEFSDARNNLALALSATGDYAGSNEEWRKLIAQAGTDLKATGLTTSARNELWGRTISARAALAENYLKSKQYADAALEYRALLKIAPSNVAAMSNLGLTLYHTKDYKAALTAYDSVLKLEPRNAIAHNNRGVVLEALNNRMAALAAYKKAVELKPDYSEAKSNRDRLLAATAVG